jgi:hypothetical protein
MWAHDWHFGIDDDSRLKKLGIGFEIMCVLPAEQSKLILPCSQLCRIRGAHTIKPARAAPCDRGAF